MDKCLTCNGELTNKHDKNQIVYYCSKKCRARRNGIKKLKKEYSYFNY